MEWAGPCPFTGLGDDRWHMWDGKGYWKCRKDCPNCPGEPTGSAYGFNRWGWLDQLGGKVAPAQPLPPPPPPPTMKDVYDSAHRLDDQVLEYLETRGIRPDTAFRYCIGRDMHAPRLTIPNIIVKSPPRCVGIKKRWLGKPPEDWIPKYVSQPGTRGASIFNWNRLVEKAWPWVVIVEGVLDVVLMDQKGITAVAPFGGGGVWSPDWTKFFRNVKDILIVADNDEDPSKGLANAKRKQEMLGRGTITLPPEGKDIGESFQAGVNLLEWVRWRLP
jgi:hypothetical protein